MTRPRNSAPPAAPSKRVRRRVLFDVGRVFWMRAAFAVIVVLFLYMILQVSKIAFGGSAAREAKHIERAVSGSVARDPAPAGATKAADPPAR